MSIDFLPSIPQLTPLTGQFINLCAAIMLLLGFAMLAQRRILTLINLFMMQGTVLAASAEPLALVVACAIMVLKLAVGGFLLALIETLSAKMRIFRAPEFLDTAYLLGVLAMLVHLLLETGA